MRRVVGRVQRRLERLGVTTATGTDGDVDPLTEESLAPRPQIDAIVRILGEAIAEVVRGPESSFVGRNLPYRT
ncbi:MAG: hypothetical protein ACREQL_07570 [Candidatus Binatia bacterium]